MLSNNLQHVFGKVADGWKIATNTNLTTVVNTADTLWYFIVITLYICQVSLLQLLSSTGPYAVQQPTALVFGESGRWLQYRRTYNPYNCR